MSQLELKEEKKTIGQSTRNDRLKEIDALYRSQLKQIHSEGKTKPNPPENLDKNSLKLQTETKKLQVNPTQNNLLRAKSSGSFLNTRTIQSSKLLGLGDTDRDPVRASTFLRGDATKNLEILRRENQTKELRIRELTNKCEGLIDKLKQFVPSQDLQGELENLRDANSDRSQRLERLFKIKTDEIFFKLKIKVISLLQDFGVSRQELSESNDIKSETQLFSFLTKKLKDRLKDFRSKEAENTFSLQKDRIVNQKQEERIHFLTETNELLKLSENKLKGKIDDLKVQLNEYIDRLKVRQHENEERQSEYFRLKKQNQQLHTVNQKLNNAIRGAHGEKSQERRSWEARQKELKQLLNSYNVEKQKLESELEECNGHIEEQLIRMKFLEQENQRMNREIIRWKERFEGLEKEKISKVKELEDDKLLIVNQFEQYKQNHNQGVSIEARNEVQEALRKVEEYQIAYQQVLEQLEDERRLLQLSEEQSEEKFENQEREWLTKVKNIQLTKEEELTSFMKETQSRMNEMKEQFQQKEILLAEELQARLKAQLAERDKRNTEQLINIQSENDELRRQIQSLSKMLEVKQSLISVLNGKKIAFQ